MGAKMNADNNALNWFEIPVNNAERAKKFYEQIFEIAMSPMDMNGAKMVMFPPSGEHGNVGGALVQSESHTPSKTGTFVYLNGNPDLQKVLDRVKIAGGKVVREKTNIGEGFGYFAYFEDSEGNTLALHSNE